jgi:isopentenyl-diphosphate delta-isomerase
MNRSAHLYQETTAERRHVVLCDENGSPQRTTDILDAHRPPGKLHRAFSIYLFSPDGQAMLVQQRSLSKRLWPGVWANTCCSHPQWGETVPAAGSRRLQEELGIILTDIVEGPAFVYHAEDPAGNGVEYEYDTLVYGTFDGEPRPNPLEVAACRWIPLDDLVLAMRKEPEQFAPWFHLGLPQILTCLEQTGFLKVRQESP